MKLTGSNAATRDKSVARVSRVAGAERQVVGDGAGGVGAADPGAGVAAVLRHTRLVPRTLRRHRALWLALDVWVTDIVADAGAGGGLVPLPALGVGAAGGGVAGLHWGRSGRGCRKHSGCSVTKDNQVRV